ncbi:MAG: MmcQ/YjbR family DNA-binding protein [Bacteriovoracaceae bacterium]
MKNWKDIEKFLKKFPGATFGVQWESVLVFKIEGKMFACLGLGKEQTSISFKCQEDDFELLVESEKALPAPYLARAKWVHTNSLKTFSKKEWEHYLKLAYSEVLRKLPKKTQKKYL